MLASIVQLNLEGSLSVYRLNHGVLILGLSVLNNCQFLVLAYVTSIGSSLAFVWETALLLLTLSI